MAEVEDKIMEALRELERWESRRAKVRVRLENDDADESELDRIEEQIIHYQKLLQDMKKKLSSADVPEPLHARVTNNIDIANIGLRVRWQSPAMHATADRDHGSSNLPLTTITFCQGL